MTCTLRSYDSTRPPSPLLPLRPLFFYVTSRSCCGSAARFLVCVVCVQVCKYFSTTKWRFCSISLKKENGLYLQLVTVPPCPPQ